MADWQPKQLGPQSLEGHQRAVANLDRPPRPNLQHGGWSLHRRGVLPPELPWSDDPEAREVIRAELEELESTLIARCGGLSELTAEAHGLIRAAVTAAGCEKLILGWAAQQERLHDRKTGEIRRALRVDLCHFQDRHQKCLRELREHHFIEARESLPGSPAAWIQQQQEKNEC